MYDLTKSKFSDGREVAFYPGTTVGKSQEGAILVSKMYLGNECAILSSGELGEVPIGFAHPDNTQRATRVVVERAVMATATNSVTYQGKSNIVTGSTRVRDITDGTDIALGAGTGSYAVTVTSGLFVLTTADCGHTVEFIYRYNLTVLEAEILDYERAINRKSTAIAQQVTALCGDGVIFTDQFNSSQNYASSPTVDLRTGVNGTFTVGGNGSALGHVIHAPDVALPLLGVAFSFSNHA